MRDERSLPSGGVAPGVAGVFVVLASAAFATSGPLARAARPAHPLVVAFGRVALAALLLLAVDGRGVVRAVAREIAPRRLAGIALAGVLLGAHLGLFIGGLDRTSVAAALSLVSLEPLSVVLWAWALDGIRPRPREWAGVLLATLGAVVVASGAGTGDHRLLGDAIVLAAVVPFGVYVSAARRLRGALPPLRYAALVYGAAAVTLAVALLFARGAFEGAVWPLGASSLACIVGLAVVPTIFGHTAVQAAARTLSPSTVALVLPGETLGGLALGALALGAAPSPTELLGASVILAGAVLALTAAR